MEQNAIDTLWDAAQCAVQRMVDFFRRFSELLKEISWKIVRSYASNMAFYFNLATDRQISLICTTSGPEPGRSGTESFSGALADL